MHNSRLLIRFCMRKSLKSYVRQKRKNIKTRMKGRGSIKKWKERKFLKEVC